MKNRVPHELTVLSREVGRTHLNHCSVLWIAETRGEPGASRGLGEVCLPDIWSYTNRANGGSERVWKRGDQELGSIEMIGCKPRSGSE